MAAKCLCKWSGCTQLEAGKFLNIGNCSSVSHRLKKLNDLLKTNNELKGIQDQIDHKLNKIYKVKV